jgi:hypothetical protein
MPQTWNNHISIRAGLLVQSEKEFNKNERSRAVIRIVEHPTDFKQVNTIVTLKKFGSSEDGEINDAEEPLKFSEIFEGIQ